ncbi:MAG: UbiX family flavin prenyltransferase [Phycisphaerae bacterium]
MSDPAREKQVVVGITGASGARYGVRLIECLVECGAHVHLVITPHGKRLLLDELGISDASAGALLGRDTERVTTYAYNNVGARLASGGFQTDGMIICPCSSNTLASVAAGLAGNLLERAAAVTLKEMRRLVVVPREMPISRIDLLNALQLSEAGAVICPASPAFYMLPETIGDLVDFVVGKLLDLLNIPHALPIRWDGTGGVGRSERRGGCC